VETASGGITGKTKSFAMDMKRCGRRTGSLLWGSIPRTAQGGMDIQNISRPTANRALSHPSNPANSPACIRASAASLSNVAFQKADEMAGCTVGYIEHRGNRDMRITLRSDRPPVSQHMAHQVEAFPICDRPRGKRVA
jgi:hypothetical protein